jgi:LAO/AO transport system kinase
MHDIVKKVIAGDVRTVARLIGTIDDGRPEAWEVLKKLYPHTGNAYIIGITGAPGVGKSTLVDQMVGLFRQRNLTVGVLAIDPTSPFSGGAILGDRIRMQRHSLDKGVYLRSLATRGYFGGLSRSTRGAIDVLDAMGKDIILVETVGVGQDEVDIVKSADTTIVVVIPGMGDEIQAIKAGVLEVGDIFVINKADQDGAEATHNDLQNMIGLAHQKYSRRNWLPPIVKTQALQGEGLSELFEEIDRHKDSLYENAKTKRTARKKNQVREVLAEMLKDRIMATVMDKIAGSGEFDRTVQAIANGTLDPYTACDTLIRDTFGTNLPSEHHFI